MTNENPAMVCEDGTYPVKELRRPITMVSAVQTRVQGVDGSNPGPGIRKNLDYMLECIDIAQSNGPPSDLLVFHEFPITGFGTKWTKDQHYNLALEVPGPEVMEVAAKAKQYGIWLLPGSIFEKSEGKI